MKIITSLFTLLAGSAMLLQAQTPPKVQSTLEIYHLDSGKRDTVYKAEQHFEAPNWSRDGKYLLYNSLGKLYTIPVVGGIPTLLNTDFATKCNNDHGISPDGKSTVISHHEAATGKSMIYTLPIIGGKPNLVTTTGPSYWHGWSPDGKTLAYCAERNGAYDIYTIPTKGGKEKKLTTADGLDDGPDYSHDGKYIYFNSVRSGLMKIWKMKTDGSGQEQVTKDLEYNDWFAHPSPDGRWIVFVSYKVGDVAPGDHPANKNVKIRLMSTAGGDIKDLADVFGGQGTINVPSWSPDSKSFAFVSYTLMY